MRVPRPSGRWHVGQVFWSRAEARLGNGAIPKRRSLCRPLRGPGRRRHPSRCARRAAGVRRRPRRGEAACVVLAAHGVTASLMTWRTVARRLDQRICLLAPDFRGRGRRAKLPGPYGMATHVADLLAVLDHVGAQSVVLVGHSMGAYVVARLAAEHPERARALVLLDAGLPFPRPEDPEEL